MTAPSVIVATEQEQTVRLYVGAPANGGMNQVAQMTLAHPIDPHDLADMAMSLSVQFGWLELSNEVGAAPKLEAQALPAVERTVSDSALGAYQTPRMAQMVKCPVKGCGHTARRKNLSQHLRSGVHKWSKDDANRAARVAQALDVPVPPLDTERSAATKAGAAKSKSVGRKRNSVSSLGIPSNMRFGTVGRRELERVGYPKILAFIEVRGEATSKMLAKHFGESTSAAKHWLNQLEKRGDLVRSNPEAGANQQHWYKLAQRELVTLAQPVTSSVGFGHEHEETNPSPIPNQESEYQGV